MKQKSWDDLFDEEFLRINFKGIRQYMSLTNWEWRGRGVPSIDDLKRNVISLFHAGRRAVKDKKYARVRSGGFSVCFFTWGETRCVEIYFDISTAEKTIAELVAQKLSG